MTELHEFSALGDEDAVLNLIYRGANVNEKDLEWGGRTPLHWAVSNGHLYVAKTLINSGASVNMRMTNGWTPLHCAAEIGHKKITQLLLENGSNPFANDRYSDTPADIARIYNNHAVVQILENYITVHGDSLTLEEEERQMEMEMEEEEDFALLKNKNDKKAVKVTSRRSSRRGDG